MRENILRIFGSIILLVFLSCTAEEIQQECIKINKVCTVNRNNTMECTEYYECY